MVHTKHDRRQLEETSHPGEQQGCETQRSIDSRLSPHHTFSEPRGSNMPQKERGFLHPLAGSKESPATAAADPDASAVLSYLKGDHSAIVELEKRHGGPLHRFLFRVSGNFHTAEDLLQETWIKVLRNLEHFDTGRSFKTWVFTIAANTYRDWMRAEVRLKARSFDNQISQDGPDTFSKLLASNGKDDPSQIAITDEEVAYLRRKLQNLNGRGADELRSHYVDGRPISEIAPDKPIGTVKSSMNAARSALKNELADDQFPDMPVARIASLINRAQNNVSHELLDAVNLRYVQRRPWHVVAFMLNCSERKAKERVREGRDALNLKTRYLPPELR